VAFPLLLVSLVIGWAIFLSDVPAYSLDSDIVIPDPAIQKQNPNPQK
jgi:hypothetical protein